MPKASKPGYYAVRVGRIPGIYHSWAECEAQVKGFVGAAYKKLGTEAEAAQFMAAKPAAARVSTLRDATPVASTSRPAALPDPIARPKALAQPTDEDEKDCDIVYCDGACKGNGQPGSIAGIGVWWGHGDPRNISERCPGDQTNNRAELIAIVRILETTPHLKRRLLIKTDSNYSIQCVTSWIFKWMRNGFLTSDGNPVKNRALIKYLSALLHVRRKTSQTVEFKHVRGHVGIEGNEAADQLANHGATMPEVQERGWEELERNVLQNLKPVTPVKVVDEDPKVHADPLDDDELVELDDVEIILPRQDPRQRLMGNPSVSPVEHRGSPPRKSMAGPTAPRPSDAATPARGKSRPATVTSPDPRPALAKKPAVVTVKKDELEIYATCLLDDKELSTLGKNGVFDSDF